MRALHQVIMLVLLLGTVMTVKPDSDPVHQQLQRVKHDFLLDLQRNADALANNNSLAQKLVRTHLIPLIDVSDLAERTLGLHWRRVSSQQQQQFVRYFTDFLISNLAAGISANVDLFLTQIERLTIAPARYRDNSRLASVELEPDWPAPLKPALALKLHYVKNRWLIHDVSVEQFSLALAFRQGFDSEIEETGLDAFLARYSRYKLD